MNSLPATVSRPLQRRFWILLLLNVSFIVFASFYLQPLNSGEIVQLEIAKQVEVAAGIVNEWKADGIKYDKAVQSIIIDYFFIVLYVAGLATGCLFLSRLSAHDVLMRTAKLLTFLLLAAGICDVVENIMLWQTLHGTITAFNVRAAYDMAVAKFSIVILTLLFIVVCLLFYFARKVSKEQFDL